MTTATQQHNFVAIINSSMKMSPWCSATAKKACKLLQDDREGTERKIKEAIVPQDKSLLHLHCEYCVRTWSLISNMIK